MSVQAIIAEARAVARELGWSGDAGAVLVLARAFDRAAPDASPAVLRGAAAPVSPAVASPRCATAQRATASRAEQCRRAVLWLLAHARPMTADELAVHLDLSILYVRPRVSELVRSGRLCASNQRGTNTSGKPANKWTLA